ncbi:MAG: helix-turn-helix transcriptional regulator [Nitrosomonas sp.]|nr:helix-turn-helix transcriptional regulator [Nitrosomonas sp.]
MKKAFCPDLKGDHMLKRRLILELTQAEVGKLFNVSPGTILNWEKGCSEPKILHIPALIKFLGYDPINPTPNE